MSSKILKSGVLFFLLLLVSCKGKNLKQVGVECLDDSECTSTYCNPDGFCSKETCYDGWQNGIETSVDCGGNCEPCFSEDDLIFSDFFYWEMDQNQNAIIPLPDGATINIPNFSGVMEVEMGKLKNSSISEWFSNDNLLVENVYQVNITRKGGSRLDLAAIITIPINIQGLSSEEAVSYEIAYLQNNQWVSVPSSINLEEGTISAKLDHFSLIGVIKRLLGNDPPSVIVHTTPRVYSNIKLEDTINLNLDDLIIEVYAHDPESKPLDVSLSIGFATDETMFAAEAHALREQTADLIVLEAAMFDIIGGELFATEPIKKITDQLGGHIDKTTLLDWVQYSPDSKYQGIDGQYYYKYRVGLSDISLLSSLNAIHVMVRVRDDLQDNPVEKVIIIPVTGKELPTPPRLIAPGPSSKVVCPPTPTFNWAWTEDSDLAESYGFYFERGDALWDSTLDWVCVFSASVTGECSRLGTDHVWDTSWTPSAPLKDGVYTWGMALSTEGSDLRFSLNDPMITRSNEFQFTVSSSLSGSDCIYQTEKHLALPEPADETSSQPPEQSFEGFTDLRTALQYALMAIDLGRPSVWLLLMDPSISESERISRANQLVSLIAPYQMTCLGYVEADIANGLPWFSGRVDDSIYLRFRATRENPPADKFLGFYIARPGGENASPYYQVIPYYLHWDVDNWGEFDPETTAENFFNNDACPGIELIAQQEQPEEKDVISPTQDKPATKESIDTKKDYDDFTAYIIDLVRKEDVDGLMNFVVEPRCGGGEENVVNNPVTMDYGSVYFNAYGDCGVDPELFLADIFSNSSATCFGYEKLDTDRFSGRNIYFGDVTSTLQLFHFDPFVLKITVYESAGDITISNFEIWWVRELDPSHFSPELFSCP